MPKKLVIELDLENENLQDIEGFVRWFNVRNTVGHQVIRSLPRNGDNVTSKGTIEYFSGMKIGEWRIEE